MVKRGPRRQRAPLQQELNGALLDRVAFDVIGPLPITGNGKRFILTMIDYFQMMNVAWRHDKLWSCHHPMGIVTSLNSILMAP